MQGDNSKSKQFIEKIYIANDKDKDATINMILTGDIPEEEKTELKIIEVQPKKSSEEFTMIDSTVKKSVR